MTKCPKCGRPHATTFFETVDSEGRFCGANRQSPGFKDAACFAVAAAYRRGAEAMREACIAEALKLGIYPGMAREIFGRIDVEAATQTKKVHR